MSVSYPAKRGVTPDSDPGSSPAFGGMDSGVYLKVRAHYAGVDGNLVPRMCRRLIRAGTGSGSTSTALGSLTGPASVGHKAIPGKHG